MSFYSNGGRHKEKPQKRKPREVISTFRYSGSVLFNKSPRTLKGLHHSPILRTFLNNILLDDILYIFLAFIILI